MTLAYEPQPRQTRAPALIVAAALHVGLLALVILLPAKPPPLLPVGSSVPINIVSSAPVTDTRAMQQAPQTQEAQAPTPPQPKAEPQPPAPVPAPPHFSQTSQASAKPAQKPPPPVSQHSQAPPQPQVDFSQLQKIIDSHRSSGAQASAAPKGPPKPATGPHDAPQVGQGVSASDIAGLAQLLERLWKLNCDVPGIAAVNPKVKFSVGLDGGIVVGPTALGGLDHSPNNVVAIGTRQALDAVRAATPFPAPYYGQTITVNFNAKEACSKR